MKNRERMGRCFTLLENACDCTRCSKGVINDTLRCLSCNCVFHRLCGGFASAEEEQREGVTDRTSVYDARNGMFQCAVCVEHNNRERHWYLDEVERLQDERLQRFYGTVIVRKAKSIFVRKNFLAKRKSIVLVQSTVRGLLARKKFRK